MDFEQKMCDNAFYTPRSIVTKAGRIQFWSELNQIIKDFDYGKADLIPIPHSRDNNGWVSDQSVHNNKVQRYIEPYQDRPQQMPFWQSQQRREIYNPRFQQDQSIPL